MDAGVREDADAAARPSEPGTIPDTPPRGHPAAQCIRDGGTYEVEPVSDVVFTPGRCTSQELTDITPCVQHGSASPQCKNASPISSDCSACLFGAGSEPHPLTLAPAGDAQVDLLGCLEGVEPGAGRVRAELWGCIRHACADCSADVMGSCQTAAYFGQCKPQASAYASRVGGNPALRHCEWSRETFVSRAMRVARLWCGQP
jgi:hypothetical protein